MTGWRADFLERERLPESYLNTAARYFEPLAERLGAIARQTPLLRVAINGCQGSGKSTLGAFLAAALPAEYRLSTVVLSIDDFYLTRAERQRLASEVHPLLLTRGVPGTHDVALLQGVLKAFGDFEHGDPPLAIPRFDKSRDDRMPEDDWQRITEPVRVVILEGWCLGVRSEDDATLEIPVNDLERREDANGEWRRYCNERLARDYEPLYADFDFWVMLKAPAFDNVLAWRREQEEKLASRVDGRGRGLMNEEQLRRFVAHYERHTRSCLEQLPASVDVLYELDNQRAIMRCTGL